MDNLFQITTNNACYGIVVRDGFVIETAPIGRWLLGQNWIQAKKRLVRYGAKFVEIGDEK